MNLRSWITVFVSLIFLVKLDNSKIAVNASSPVSMGILNRFDWKWKGWQIIFFEALTRNLNTKLLLLDAPPVASTGLGNLNESDDYLMMTSTNLRLGDVLIGKNGEIYFFMTGAGSDRTLMKASTGILELNSKIDEFVLIETTENSLNKFLDYQNVENVNDLFIIIQEYGGFVLLKSTTHSMLFSAPTDSVDFCIRKKFQAHKNLKQSSEAKKITVEKENYKNEIKLKKLIKSDNTKEDEKAQASPTSVAFLEREHRYRDDKTKTWTISELFSNAVGSESSRFEFITENFVMILLEGNLSVDDGLIIVRTVMAIFATEATVGNIQVEKDENVTVVGDIHGQFMDLLRIFEDCGWPGESKKYLFNGDIVDRGSMSIECLLLLYILKITFPRSLYINRGNHESRMCGDTRFYQDSMKFDASGMFFRTCQEGFVALPLAHVINDRIYVVHGGVRGEYEIKKFSKIDRFVLTQELKEFLLTSLWDDPSDELGISNNSLRGPNCYKFGPDITAAFLKLNNFVFIIRSHSLVQDGIKVSQGGACFTLFSAPNYNGSGNAGAVVTLNANLVPEFSYFPARK